MDPKARAKAKRAHSLRGRHSHPPPGAAAAAAAAAAQKKKAAAAQPQTPGEQPAKPRRSRDLPSNWDRYDEEGDDGDGGAQSRDPSAEAAPKSKGADFGFLMEQACSQPAALRVPAPDEIHIDFIQVASSLISFKGKSLLSRCEDDYFNVDDGDTPHVEVPYLSMDLNALADQLSELKTSQMLFIEADLFPEELGIGEPEQQQETSEQPGTSSSIEGGGLVQPSGGNSSHTCMEVEFLKGPAELGSPPAFVGDTNQVEHDHHREVLETVIPKVAPMSRFEAVVAESELDKLLESFGEVGLSGSKNDNIDTAPTSAPAFTGHLAAAGSLDDDIDNLLAMTVPAVRNQKQGELPSIVPTRLPGSTESTTDADFDSWLDTLH